MDEDLEDLDMLDDEEEEKNNESTNDKIEMITQKTGLNTNSDPKL